MANAQNNAAPTPPDDLADEALLEWGRVCEELRAAGLLAKSDRSILALYCQTYAINREAAKHVATFGSVLKLANNVVCQSPFYKTVKETSAQLRVLLADLGLTPAARAKAGAKEPVGDLQF